MTVINDFRGEYGFLSNFHSSPFEYKGLVYPNSEAAFQAQKCATEEAKIKYTTTKNPVVIKSMGKKEPGLPANWDEISYDIMLDVLRAKFRDPALREKLLATGDAYLEEGNHWHDNRWGRCTCEKCKNKEAKNQLGKILMTIRDEIRSEMKEDNKIPKK